MSAIPPNPPWKELNSETSAGGYLSFYYSDDMSRLPVRWVTKPGDNKSDPNIETCTYGLFSTCSPSMRSGIVKRHAPFVFFCTRRGLERKLSGYYRVRWHTYGPLGRKDICIAADKCHFVADAIPLCVVDKKTNANFSKPFRGMRLVSQDECEQLAALLHEQPNAKEDYLDEIDRLERFNLKHGGHRYMSWKQTHKFDWAYAEKYLVTTSSPILSTNNMSPTEKWQCSNCSEIVKNKALLKRCPMCGKLATLKPIT